MMPAGSGPTRSAVYGICGSGGRQVAAAPWMRAAAVACRPPQGGAAVRLPLAVREKPAAGGG